MSTNKRGIDPAIIAAVIGVMGTLCVTLISLYANRVLTQPQPQPTLPPPQATLVVPTWTMSPTATLTDTPVPTSTVPIGEPTSTPAPDTPIPLATFTPAPPTIGSDWANGCISTLWKPFPSTIPTTEKDGCLVEPVNLFFAADGRLTFLVTGEFNNNQVVGLFAPLPANGTVSLQTLLRSLQQGEIWMGIFAEPNIDSQGTLIVIPAGDVRNRPIIQKTMPGQADVQKTDSISRDPPLYDASFQLNNGSVTATVVQQTFNPVQVVSAQPWLFVGYQIKQGRNRIDAEFLNLVAPGQ